MLRTLALTASIGLVLVNRDERGAGFWVGVALVGLNLVGLLAHRTRAAGDASRDHRPEEGRSHLLGDMLRVPGVAAALAAGPPQWRQVSYLDDFLCEPSTAEQLAAYIWIEYDDGWEIGLGDEVKPYLDLDIAETDDPVIGVLETHPAVAEAYHEDREVYRVVQRQPMSAEEFAVLAAHALVSHHLRAAARA